MKVYCEVSRHAKMPAENRFSSQSFSVVWVSCELQNRKPDYISSKNVGT